MRRWIWFLALVSSPAFAQDSYLSALPADASIDGTEEFYCEDSGNTIASVCTVSSIVATAAGTNPIFKTVNAPSGTDPVADSVTDTLNVTCSGGLTCTGDSSTDTVDLVVGNVATATALAANGANCSAGNYPLGVDASGAVESCTSAATAGTTDWVHDTTYDLHYTDRDGDAALNVDGSEGIYIPRPRYGLEFKEEFVRNAWAASTSNGDFYYSATGTAADCAASNTTSPATNPGVWSCDTGTTNAGASQITTAQDPFLFGGGIMVAECEVRLPILSTSGERFLFYCGWNDYTIGGDSKDACFMLYRDDINSGKWQGRCDSNTSSSVVDTTVTVANNTWYRLTTFVNAAGTLATFCVNGANCVTVNSNIPTGAGRNFGLAAVLSKSVGSTSREVLLDYIHGYELLTTAR